MTTQMESLLMDRGMDLHTLFQPSAFGIKDGLDTAFESPHEKVKLIGSGEIQNGVIGEVAIGPYVIENGWFDLSSLRFVQTQRITNAADANQPIDYDGQTTTPAPASYIAFQNGATLWANMKDAKIEIRGTVLATYQHPWFEDIQQKYLYNTDAVNSFGKVEGFAKDTGAADVRTTLNTGYGTRSALVRPGTASAAATAFTTISYMDAIPLFREKRLVYLPKGNGISITFTTRAYDDREMIERGATAVAAQRYLDRFYGEIDKYYPVNAVAESLKALYLSAPQKFVYSDYRVDKVPITATTSTSKKIELPRGKINAMIIGFQLQTAINKRQFTPCNVTKLFVQTHADKQFPANGGYTLPAENNKAYFDYMVGMKEIGSGPGAILDPTTHSTIFKLYYIDLKHGVSNIPEAADEINKSDFATVYAEFSTGVDVNMYVMTLSDTKIEMTLDPNVPVKVPQGPY